MIAGILLGRFGIDGAAAITAIRQARPGSIETEAQEDFVRGWVQAELMPAQAKAGSRATSMGAVKLDRD